MVLQEFPTCLNPLLHSAQRALSEHRGDESLAIIERARRAHPQWREGLIRRLHVLLTLERFQQVLAEVQQQFARADEVGQVALLEVKARALSRAGASLELVDDVLSDIRRRASTNSERLTRSYMLEGALHIERGEAGQALAAYREAYRAGNGSDALWYVARIAESLGDRAQALWAYVSLCQRASAESCEKRDALLRVSGEQPRR